MKKIIVSHNVKKKSYPIHIGSGIVSLVSKNSTVPSASKVVIITDEIVTRYWLSPLIKALQGKTIIVITVPSGEKHKTHQTLEMIWKQMLGKGVDRSSVVIALGGGVVCDIGGFAAGTFMRGIPVIHIPTTLLAQVDASVGGKTAIDFGDIKNSIGIFHQPSAVIIDVQTLNTLPYRQIVSGYAEIIKHGIIADRRYFDSLSKVRINEIDEEAWIRIITRSVQIKKRIVQADEEENNGIRKRLNFGHTVGHAIESLSLNSAHPLLHGEAVAIGMMAETRMSRLAGVISQKDEKKIISTISKLDLSTKVSDMSLSQIQEALLTDKKNKNGEVLWSLPIRIGRVESDRVLSHEVIKEGIASIIK